MPERKAGHLTPEDFSAYLSGAHGGRSREEAERHLVVCDSCRSELLAASEVNASSPARRWVVVAMPVVAAAALAALLLVPWGGPPTSGVAPEPGSILRGGESEGIPTLSVVEPGPGAAVSPSEIRFQWRSAGRDPFYRITVTSEEGDIVWTATSQDTILGLPSEIPMEAGARYFWFVDALLPGAETATTGVQEFLVRIR